MPNKDLEPYGKEWEKELMKHTKQELINRIRTLRQNDRAMINNLQSVVSGLRNEKIKDMDWVVGELEKGKWPDFQVKTTEQFNKRIDELIAKIKEGKG